MTARASRRRRLADQMIRLGLILQIVFLLLVDWASIAGFWRAGHVPLYHVFGLIFVNVFLAWTAAIAWSWMGRMQRQERAES